MKEVTFIFFISFFGSILLFFAAINLIERMFFDSMTGFRKKKKTNPINTTSVNGERTLLINFNQDQGPYFQCMDTSNMA